jgi:hypothetical protein
MSEAVVSSNGYSYCNDDCLPLSYLIARAGPVTIPDYSALVGLATTWGRPIFEKRDDGSWLKRERLTLPTLTETERRWAHRCDCHPHVALAHAKQSSIASLVVAMAEARSRAVK